MAVRVPWAKVAGALAIDFAIRPNRPEVCRSMRRSKSSGSRAMSRPMTIASPASAAGITVPERGASPESTPVRSNTPKITRAAR